MAARQTIRIINRTTQPPAAMAAANPLTAATVAFAAAAIAWAAARIVCTAALATCCARRIACTDALAACPICFAAACAVLIPLAPCLTPLMERLAVFTDSAGFPLMALAAVVFVRIFPGIAAMLLTV